MSDVQPTVSVVSVVPCGLNMVLEIQNSRRSIWEEEIQRMLCMLHVRNLHLRVPVATESAFPVEFAYLGDSRMTQECFTDCGIALEQSLQNRQNTWCFPVDGFMIDESTMPTDLLGTGNFRPVLKTFVQGLGHLLFVGIWTKSRFLVYVKEMGQVSTRVSLHQDEGHMF